MNRYGMESAALQEQNVQAASLPSSLLQNDGNTLLLPAKAKLADFDHYELLDVQGRAIRSVNSRLVRQNQLNIAALPDGMYQLKGYTKKKAHHALGYFLIRR